MNADGWRDADAEPAPPYRVIWFYPEIRSSRRYFPALQRIALGHERIHNDRLATHWRPTPDDPPREEQDRKRAEIIAAVTRRDA